MTATASTTAGDVGQGPCWCCGTSEGTGRLVHLHDHPEVAVCIPCAHWLSTSAWELEDRGRTGFAVRVRGRLRWLRQFVIERDWHDNRVIGRPLRWLGRYLP